MTKRFAILIAAVAAVMNLVPAAPAHASCRPLPGGTGCTTDIRCIPATITGQCIDP